MTWPTDEQVEKAAIALRLKKMRSDPTALPWTQIHEIFQDEYRATARAALSAINPYEWRPIETCPRHVDVDFYRADAGVFSGQYTYCADWLNEEESQEFSEEDLFSEDPWGFDRGVCQRLEGDERPTHWRPKALPPTEGV